MTIAARAQGIKLDNERYVNNMKEEAVREELIFIRDKLDELDQDDFFGTQGWLYQFGMGD